MRKLSLLILTILLPMLANADDVEIDGIYYNLDAENKTAVTTKYENYNSIEVVIPESVNYDGVTYTVTSIGAHSFYSLPDLISLTIPSSVTSIGDQAFCYNHDLSVVVSEITEPFAIGADVFYNYWGEFTQATLYVPEGTKAKYEATDGWNLFKNIVEGIPPSQMNIGDTFTRKNIDYVVIGTDPLEVQVGGGTYEKQGTYYYNTGDINIPAIVIGNDKEDYTVTAIADYAFHSCRIASLSIPNTVRKIGLYAIIRCKNLSAIKVDEGNQFYDSRDDCNALIETNTNTLIAGCKNTVIPNTVTSIGYGAFEGAEGLTSITIPNSVTYIGQDAFEGCKSLTSVTIPNSITIIEDFVFKDCNSLTDIKFPSALTEIGSYAFYECRSLTSLFIPKSVISIGVEAFSFCSNLTSIEVEEGNPRYYSQEKCNAIIDTKYANITLDEGCMNTVIPDIVQTIGVYAFSGRNGLTSISFPNSVKLIQIGAFYMCRDLTSVTIPNSVIQIERKSFMFCSSLTSVVSEITEPFAIDDNTFAGEWDADAKRYSPPSATLYVPFGTKEKYQAAEGWKLFENIVEMEPTVEPGDVTGDGKVNGTDIQAVINVITDEEYIEGADINKDGKVNGTDIQEIINIIIEEK